MLLLKNYAELASKPVSLGLLPIEGYFEVESLKTGCPWWLSGKESPAMQETQVESLGLEDSLEKKMATHSSILDWEIPWTEEPGRLPGCLMATSCQSMRLQESDTTKQQHWTLIFWDFITINISHSWSIYWTKMWSTGQGSNTNEWTWVSPAQGI